METSTTLGRMKLSESIIEEFIYGGHWLSLGASSVALSTILLFNLLPIKWEFLLIVYFGTQCIYNYNHYKDINIDYFTNPERVNHLYKYHKYGKIIISIYGLSYFIVLFIFGTVQSIIFGTALIGLGVIFSLKIIDALKKMVGAKLIYTSFSWSLLIPFTMIYHSQFLNYSILIFTLFVFLRIIITTTFFDIKDAILDRKRGITTVPVVLGRKKSLTFLQLVNLISIMPIILAVFIHMLPLYSFPLTLLFFYSFFYIQKARDTNVEITNLSYVIVDGEFYYWPILILLLYFIN